MTTFNAIRSKTEHVMFESMLGKKVFFVTDNKIVYGIVNGYDANNLFVGKEYGLSGDKPFFYSEEELVEFLITTKINASEGLEGGDMPDYLIKTFFDDLPYVIVIEPNFDSIKSRLAQELVEMGHDNKTVFWDLLLRNGASDRVFTIRLTDGRWDNASCKPVVLSYAQFEKTYEFFKENSELLDHGVLNNSQKYLMRKGSADQQYRNYCYFERQRESANV